ncbi:MAG: hypothetical protein ABIJ46_01320 [bacterium]
MSLSSNSVPKRAETSFCGEDVKLISYCPLCESSYTPSQTRVLGEKEGSHLLHMTCGKCSNAILALVIISSAGVSSVGLSTDLACDEVDRFKNSPVVSTNDVIDMHHLLQNDDQLFAQLGC